MVRKMEKGLISTIQGYSIKDGPGIRSTVFCVGCNLRCRWCSNPELMLPGKKVMRFQLEGEERQQEVAMRSRAGPLRKSSPVTACSTRKREAA